MGEPKDNIAIAAAFLSGFYTLQTLNFCWTASFPTLLKFGIPPSKIGCFMGETGASMNYWVSWGILLSFGLSFCGWTGGFAFIAPGISTVIYILAFAYTWYVKPFNWWKALLLFILVLGPPIGALFFIGIKDNKNKDEAAKQIGKFVCPIVSCFTTVCTFITHCIIFYVVVFGHGYEGVRKLYFWLCASALAYQFDSSITVKVAGGQVAWLFFAMEVSYFIIPFIHLCCERSHKALGVHDLNFFTVFWHVFAICITTGMALELWIVNIYMNWAGYSSTSADKDARASLVRCLSPFLMGILGMGSIFWLFPAVWPFMVCHYAHFQFVMLFSAVLSSPATLIPLALCDGDKIHKKFGGNLMTKFDNSAYGLDGKAIFYHMFWMTILFIFVLFWIHMCCIHYPRCFVARSVLHTRWAVVCGSLFFFLTSLFKAFGLDGCFANAIGPNFSAVISGTFKNVAGAKITITGNGDVTFGNEFKFDANALTLAFNGRTLKTDGYILFGRPVVIIHQSANSNKTSTVQCGDVSLTSVTVSNGKLQFEANATISLGLTSAEPFEAANDRFEGGAQANKKLTKIEIKGLRVAAGLTVAPTGRTAKTVTLMDITLEFDSGGIPGTGQTAGSGPFSYNLSQGTMAASSKVKLYKVDGQTEESAALSANPLAASSTVTVSSSNQVSINTLTFNDTDVTFNSQTLTGSSVSLSSSTSQMQLFGTNADGAPIESGEMTGPVSTLLSVNGSTLTHRDEIDLRGVGANNANQFQSGSGHKLTKIGFKNVSLNGFEIDGYPLSSDATLTFVFPCPIPYSNAFITSAQGFESGFMKSQIEFPDTFDLAHGPAFGTVGFNFSLFHLTASIFTSQAYSVGIGSFRCAVDSGCSWPTQGLGVFRSFFWWLNYGLRNGNRRFRSLAQVDIISVMS